MTELFIPKYASFVQGVWRRLKNGPARAGRALARLAAESGMARRGDSILWMPVFFAAGIGFYFSLPFEPSVPLSLAPAAAGLVCMAALLATAEEEGRQGARLAAGLLLLALLGFACAKIRTQAVSAPILQKSISFARVEGTISDIDRLEEGKGMRVVLRDLVIEKLPAAETPVSLRLKIAQDAPLETGMRIAALAGLSPVSAPAYPGAFDFQRYAYFHRLGAMGFSYRAPEILPPEEEGGENPHARFSESMDEARRIIATRVYAKLPATEASIVTALVTGEQTGIPKDVWQDLRESGLAHMLVISGMNISFIAGTVFFFVRLLLCCLGNFALHYPVKKIAALSAFAVAAAYVCLVGVHNIPALRALLMTGVVIFAILIDRNPFSLRLVALSALAILVFMPESLVGASFQLSFAAITAIIGLYEIYKYEIADGRLSLTRKPRSLPGKCAFYLAAVCVTTAVATVATAPFSLYHFGQLPVLGVISNVLAVPIMSIVIMPALFVSCLLMPLGLDWIGYSIAAPAIRAVLAIAHETAALPASLWTPPAMPLPAFVLTVTGGLLLLLGRKHLRVMSLLAFFAAGLLFYHQKQPDILISSSGKLVAVRQDSPFLAVSSLRGERFTAQNWLRYYGMPENAARIWTSADFPEKAMCDEQGCRLGIKGKAVTLSLHPSGLDRDWASSDVLISRRWVNRPARSAKMGPGQELGPRLVIEHADLKYEGAHAVYLDEMRAVSVKDTRGVRPWTAYSGR